MSGDTEAKHVDPPDEVFSALGDETRLRILLELTAVVNEHGWGTGLSFSELRERVGIEDSGRSNHHLDTLSGRFIRKREGRYVPQGPGMSVASAVYADRYDGAGDGDPHTTTSDWPCPMCDRQLTLSYGGHCSFVGVSDTATLSGTVSRRVRSSNGPSRNLRQGLTAVQ